MAETERHILEGPSKGEANSALPLSHRLASTLPLVLALVLGLVWWRWPALASVRGMLLPRSFGFVVGGPQAALAACTCSCKLLLLPQ